MALQSSNVFLAGDAFNAIRSNATGWKASAQNALSAMQAGSVNSDFIFRLLDQTAAAIAAMTTWKETAGLDAYATAQGYSTTLSDDCVTSITAAQAILSWVTTFFPASGAYLQAYTLNANGSRTPRQFTSTQTAGLQTALQSFIASIG